MLASDASDEQIEGPAKQIVTALTHRGVDLTDRDAVDQAIHQLDAENLAHRLLPQTAGPERTCPQTRGPGQWAAKDYRDR